MRTAQCSHSCVHRLFRTIPLSPWSSCAAGVTNAQKLTYFCWGFRFPQEGFAPLHQAAYYNRIGAARALIEGGADLNAQDRVCLCLQHCLLVTSGGLLVPATRPLNHHRHAATSRASLYKFCSWYLAPVAGRMDPSHCCGVEGPGGYGPLAPRERSGSPRPSGRAQTPATQPIARVGTRH